MERFLVVHYHEIGLKGGNRALFEHRLRRNIDGALAGLAVGRASRLPGRLVVEVSHRCQEEEILERLRWVPGIAYFAPAWRVRADLEVITRAVLAMLEEERPAPGSFAVRPRRADKNFAHDSMEIGRVVGAAVQERRPWPVDLSNPELEIAIEVLHRHAYVYSSRLDGPGGLPVGTGGRVMALLSGGIDSPVAAFQLMKRGCRAELVHFHAVPFTSPRSRQKVVELARVLCRVQGRTVLHQVGFGQLQRELVLATPAPYRVILYRRFMARIAQVLAGRSGCLALVTGESLGQVASQTLRNLATIEEAVGVPILRPLVGLDKQEIVDRARWLGTFEISIQPYEDCCSLFVPDHPVTRASVEDVRTIEAELDIASLVAGAVEATETEEVSLRGALEPAAEH